MNIKQALLSLSLLITSLISSNAISALKPLDHIVAVVNEDVLPARMQANQPELSNVPQRQIFETVVAEMTPLGGEQTPEDIGNLAVFYASDAARMITGQAVAVDGGITLRRA